MLRRIDYFETLKSIKYCTNTQSKVIVKKTFKNKLTNRPKSFSRYSFIYRCHRVINSSKPFLIKCLKDSKKFDEYKSLGLEIEVLFKDILGVENLRFTLDT